MNFVSYSTNEVPDKTLLSKYMSIVYITYKNNYLISTLHFIETNLIFENLQLSTREVHSAEQCNIKR